MIALHLDQLDLSGIREHVKLMHGRGPAETAGALSLPNLARLHAQWHVHPGSGHKHGGDMTSVQVADGLFSVHPLGWFTGREAKLAEEHKPSVTPVSPQP